MLTRELLLERQIIYPEVADLWAEEAAARLTRSGLGEDPILTEWCRRVLRNWIIRDYQGVERVLSRDDYRYYHPDHTPFGGAEDVEPPDWFIKGLEAGQEFFAFANLPGILPREIEQIIEKADEVLRSLIDQMAARGQNQEQIRQRILRLSVPGMLEMWQREHERIARAAEKARRLGRNQDGGGVRLIMTLSGGLAAYEFVTDQPPSEPSRSLRMALRNETIEMGICVGDFSDPEALRGGYGQQYAEGVEDGTKRIFSLRDPQGASHVTIDTVKGAISQVKGKENKPPVAKYIPDTLEFLNHLGLPSRSRDLQELGVYEGEGRYSMDFREVSKQVLMLDDGTEVYEVKQAGRHRLWYVRSGETKPFFGLLLSDEGSFIQGIDRQFASDRHLRDHIHLILPVLNEGGYSPVPAYVNVLLEAGYVRNRETRRWERYDEAADLIADLGEFYGDKRRFRLYRLDNQYEIVLNDPDDPSASLWRAMVIYHKGNKITHVVPTEHSRWGRKSTDQDIMIAALNAIGLPMDPLNGELREFSLYCSGTRYGQRLDEVGKLVMRFEGDIEIHQLKNGTNTRETIYVLLDDGSFIAVLYGKQKTLVCDRSWTRSIHGSAPPQLYWRYIKLLCQKAGLTLIAPKVMIDP